MSTCSRGVMSSAVVKYSGSLSAAVVPPGIAFGLISSR